MPSEVKAETGTSVTVTLDDPYEGAPSEWTLRAETNLTGERTWQISKRKFGSGSIENESGSGGSIETTVSQSNDDESITLTITGTMPNRSVYNYDPQQNLSAITLYRVTDSGETKVDTINVPYYTAKSKEARKQIDQAKQAIDEAGSVPDSARTDYQSAIEFYNSGQFASAIREANSAQEAAQQAEQSQQTTQLLIYGGVGILVLALIGGGVWYWRNQQDDYDKLR
ncbi:hypothetical protein ACOZ4N_18145 [Halorientalis pallida]|uniref:hypothetical protein n=1 Tax=Halorientalis pallida TaxID=2479928 RepID=UPI003C6F2FC1